jgi:hypothetical protein
MLKESQSSKQARKANKAENGNSKKEKANL